MSDNSPGSNPDAAESAPTPPPAPGYAPPPAYAPPAEGSAPNYPSGPGYAAPVYPQGGYSGTQGYGYPSAPKTNTLAIVSLVSSIAAFVILPFLGSLVGVITGHMSLSQIKRTGENGRGLALAGTIVGWVGLGFVILTVVFLLLLLPAMLLSVPTSYS